MPSQGGAAALAGQTVWRGAQEGQTQTFGCCGSNTDNDCPGAEENPDDFL